MAGLAHVHQPDELLLGFARALRAAGITITQDRTLTFLRASAAVGVEDEHGTYWAGRATLCSTYDDLQAYDQVFSAWFHGQPTTLPGQVPHSAAVSQAPLGDDREAGGDMDPEGCPDVRTTASDIEVLRHRDIAELSAADRARHAALFATLLPHPPQRTAYRSRPSHRGDIDQRATLRRTLRNLGEPTELAWHRRATQARRVVLLIDVSGSMSPYADSMVRLAHRIQHGLSTRSSGGRRGAVEVFTLGTQITRITRALATRDADRALVVAGETVPDWSGGTRLGETLKAFLDRWGQRGMARGSVVVVISDGWERGDASLLAGQMARLHRLAHRVVWMNPHQGLAGYQPVQKGMAAALPSVDDFVAGHSLAAFANLLQVVAAT
jgi:uncharacterized protein with von Willebrand factor type A (vWA) domain